MRTDLLALTDDDLVALSNRGNVRRARSEVDAGELTVDMVETDDGSLEARWSDGVVCTLPNGLGVARGRCSCPADPPCRHLIRTVMSYRARTTPSSTAASDAPARVASTVGLPKGLEARARKRFDEGQLFELARSTKPIARCHSLGVVTRFFVVGDPNHAVCDCGDPAPCEHALMALWAFDRLPEGVESGLVDTRTSPYPVPTDVLDSLEGTLAEWVRVGVADAPSAMVDRLRSAETSCRKAGLSWFAEALDELAALKVAYDARDARFDPARLCNVIGELVARSDATRNERGLVPPLFVRGTAMDRTIDVALTRLVGLGCGVRVRRASLQLTTFAQSEDTGQILAVVREVAHGANESKPLAEASRLRIAKGITLGDLASGRTLARGLKRSAGGVLSFGRGAASCVPQAFSWESLRAPALAEGFGEVRAHIASLPPTPLRPRRLGEDVYVIPIGSVANARFDSTEQAVKATLVDGSGGMATLVHPFVSRAAAGADALLAALAEQTILYVAGRVRGGSDGLLVEPISLVVERDGARSMVMPWLAASAPSSPRSSVHEDGRGLGPERFVQDELANALGECFAAGLEAFTPVSARIWHERASQAEALGFHEIPRSLHAFADAPDVPRSLALAALIGLADASSAGAR